ncbi:Cpd1p [Sugiyamaella lignohabitans]|uniref:2',3'-cyclic-nucleotide 3'-phosphodiesterase n=1 Tax=Sugiyamaella lignohabitans TaxID=796027 RepID=A0A161HH28_9ASCO|nr:Cpd1p [Sugiyamaella lignohabitans]ANB11277.1 Cpd1p [Sugiyamaella lignohabitans]
MPKKGSPLYDALKATIDSLKTLFDDGVIFLPHLTITSDIHCHNQAQVDSILDTALAASKAVPQIPVIVDGLVYGSLYFKKVFLSVVPAPELVSLARICREEFVTAPMIASSEKNYSALSQEERDSLSKQAAQIANDWARDEYKPHVSLAYSNMYPVDEALQGTIDMRLTDTFGEHYATRGIGWTGGRLALVRCEGNVEDWVVLGHRDI